VLLRDKFLKLPHGNANIELLATRHAKDIIYIMYLTYIECLFIEKHLSHYKERTASLLKTKILRIHTFHHHQYKIRQHSCTRPPLPKKCIKGIAAVEPTVTRLTRIRNAPGLDVNRKGTILAGIGDFPLSFQTNDEIILGK
jgi:hypothetical protein